MIKAVIFDIDNTMYSFDNAHKRAMEALGAYAEKTFGMKFEQLEALVKKCMDIVKERTGENCAAWHNRLLRFQCLLEQIGDTDYQKAMEMYHVYWDTVLEMMEPEPGLIELILRLKEKGIKIGIGSDMTAYIQYKKLKKLGVLQYLDFLVTSEEAGAEKPTPRFFELCVKKAGCRPKECIFIGDSPEKDVLGPAKCGLVGIWYNPQNKKREEAAGHPEIASYEEYLREEKWEENK